MKKIFSLLYLLIIFNILAFSQQDPQFTNNMFYKLGVNPGFSGAGDAINGLILKRYQWEGMKGAPKTTVFAVDAALDIFGNPGGLGLNIVNDQLGFEKNLSINASYAYKADLSIGKLGVGLSVGLFNKSINGEWMIPDDDNLGIYTQPDSDPYIPQGENSQMAFDLGAGLYLSSNKYYLGVSATHLNQAPISFSELVSAYLSRHYYFMGGYNIKLPDPLFEVRPSVFFKTDLAGWQLDVNANIIYDDRFWGGVSFRMNDAVALLLGIELFNGLNLGYSFDLVTSSIGYYGFASHELFINYSIDLERDRNKKYKSIRFL
ncbi:MAG: type IX secretion system membrane protein PorP/SprF [Bacteroidales bacterium]|jgi:type IX secretion system PorP/SprF family membrane protein|nr:type IX secretion system membrane protein PorP/SprF [Bacteroidales bacterium]